MAPRPGYAAGDTFPWIATPHQRPAQARRNARAGCARGPRCDRIPTGPLRRGGAQVLTTTARMNTSVAYAAPATVHNPIRADVLDRKADRWAVVWKSGYPFCDHRLVDTCLTPVVDEDIRRQEKSLLPRRSRSDPASVAQRTKSPYPAPRTASRRAARPGCGPASAGHRAWTSLSAVRSPRWPHAAGRGRPAEPPGPGEGPRFRGVVRLAASNDPLVKPLVRAKPESATGSGTSGRYENLLW